MAIVSNKVINAYKSGVDVAGNLNEADIAISALSGLQHKCLFEMLIIPESLFNQDAKGIAMGILGIPLMRFQLYAVNDLPLIGFEYQRSGGFQFIKDAVYPDGFSCTFIENGLGNVKGYFRKWLDTIVVRGSNSRDYYFNDNQDISKRTGIIIPMQPDMLPSTEWIKIDGMKFKNLTGIGYDHASGEHEILTAEFTCDNIRLSFGVGAF